MSDYIKKIRTTTGDKQIDYTALANLPNLLTVDTTLSQSGKAADAKAVGEEVSKVKNQLDNSKQVFANAIIQTKQGEAVMFDDGSELPFKNIKVFGKSTQDGTPTPDAPVEIVSVVEPTVRVCGKNLLEIVAETQTVNGVTFTVNEDGTVIVNGTATADAFFEVNRSVAGVLNNTMYCLSGCPAGGSAETYFLRASDRLTKAYDDFGEGRAFSYPDVSQFVVSIRVMSGVTVSNLLFAPMVRLAEIEDDSYESYKKIQTLPVTRTLPGIPVASGGNYTDENGQQWVCDEVDFERGVYVQRIENIMYDGTETWLKSGDSITCYVRVPAALKVQPMCDRLGSKTTDEYPYVRMGTTGDGVTALIVSFGQLEPNTVDEFKAQLASHPLTVQYALLTPIETALSETEIAAYRALHANSPITTVTNDAGAWTEVSYNADASVIIKKLTNAIVALGGTV